MAALALAARSKEENAPGKEANNILHAITHAKTRRERCISVSLRSHVDTYRCILFLE